MNFDEWIVGEMDRGLSQLEVDQMRAAWDAAANTQIENLQLRIRELERETEAKDGALQIMGAGNLKNIERVRELEANYAAVAHNIASSPAKALEESVLIGQALNRLDKVQQALLAEREVSDKLEKVLQRIAYVQPDIGHPPLVSVAESMRTDARAALAEVSTLRLKGASPCNPPA